MIRLGRYVPRNGKAPRVVTDTDNETYVVYYPACSPALRLQELPTEFAAWAVKTGAIHDLRD